LRASEQEVEEEGDEQEVQEVDEQENQDAEEKRSAQEDKSNDREDSAQGNGVERSGCSVGERFVPKANSNNIAATTTRETVTTPTKETRERSWRTAATKRREVGERAHRMLTPYSSEDTNTNA